MYFSNQGYCVICEAETTFQSEYSWLRDHYLCTRCRSIPRQRALVHVLNQACPDWRDRRIHESSPSLGWLAAQCSRYSSSFFFEERQRGSVVGGQRCEDIEALTFENESFDIFITQDVLEHVFAPDKAIREINRVLASGGFHIFTVPVREDLANSVRRARLNEDGSVAHLEPAQYHGNPISAEGALVTWDYGNDFRSVLAEWSGMLVSSYYLQDIYYGIAGSFLDIFVIRKIPDPAVEAQ